MNTYTNKPSFPPWLRLRNSRCALSGRGCGGFKEVMTNDRDETIRRIKAALQRRSGVSWSVTGGRGTAWGWITIDAPPARRTWSHRLKADASPAQLPSDYEEYDCGEPGRCTSPTDRAKLKELLGIDEDCHQGVSIPASSAHYREYIDRAEGRTPATIAKAYWD